jgi:hypothetical protein
MTRVCCTALFAGLLLAGLFSGTAVAPPRSANVRARFEF